MPSHHHVEIFETHWKYLGFAWGEGDAKSFYVFTVLTSGLATACYVFTKLLRPLTKFWRAQGLRVVLYFDDGIVAANGLEAATWASYIARNNLQRSGLVTHVGKSIWTPTQSLSWLGFDLDLNEGVVSVPMSKIEIIREQLHGEPKELTFCLR